MWPTHPPNHASNAVSPLQIPPCVPSRQQKQVGSWGWQAAFDMLGHKFNRPAMPEITSWWSRGWGLQGFTRVLWVSSRKVPGHCSDGEEGLEQEEGRKLGVSCRNNGSGVACVKWQHFFFKKIHAYTYTTAFFHMEIFPQEEHNVPLLYLGASTWCAAKVIPPLLRFEA